LTFKAAASRIVYTSQEPVMNSPPYVTLKLYATLHVFMPPAGEEVPIAADTTVGALLRQIGVPEEKAQLIFIDGVKGELSTPLRGGERVGIFPPVGGG
jgi:molybdopterin converting factor small subunit